MTLSFNTSVILLTYKGKVLLMTDNYNPLDMKQNMWSMIGSKKVTHESFLEAILQRSQDIMNIKLVNVNFLFKTKHNNRIVYVSHGKLTDDNVNSIERHEGQEINFFSLIETLKLQLEPFTNSFFVEYKNELEKILVN